MKSIIIILGSLLLFSCNNDQVVLTQEEYKQLKNEPVPEYPKFFEIKEVTYGSRDGIYLASDKHEYLVLSPGSNSANISHYIDCKLCKPETINQNGSKNKKIKY